MPDFDGNTIPVALMTAQQMLVGVWKFKLVCMTTYSIVQAQKCDSPSNETAVLTKLKEQLLQLWTLHGGASDSGQLKAMGNRAAEVLVEDAKSHWGDYQSICEDAVEAARQLWHHCEALVIAAAEVEGLEGNRLLCRCKRLLEASDLLIASEEEILCLMDTGTGCYSRTHENSDLCWQQHFFGQV
jgi:hypothetical protein